MTINVIKLARLARRRNRVMAVLSLALSAAPGLADRSVAQAEVPTAREALVPPAPGNLADKIDPASDSQLFCNNIRNAAMDAHARRQAAEIQRMEAALRERATELEARQKDLQAWLIKREAIMKKAEESVVSIYGRMQADAAAIQIAAMDDDMAISILSKLNPRTSSAILNEMEPARAAHLTSAVISPATPKPAVN